MKKLIYLIIVLAIANAAFAQKSHSNLSNIASYKEGSNWYIFDKGFNPSKENINHRIMKEAFGFDQDNSFQFLKTFQDEWQVTHHFFQQYYKGYPIQFAEFRLHEYPTKRMEGNGYFISTFNHATNSPVISFSQALQKAKEFFPALKYMWEDSEEENLIKLNSQNPLATYFPKEQVLWAMQTKDLQDLRQENYRLAYRIRLAAKMPWFDKDVYIDALTGELINQFELEYKCGTHAFNSNFNGSRIVSYSSIFTGIDFLRDDCGLGDIITTSDNQSASSPYQKLVFQSWPTSGTNFLSACTSQWSLRIAESYYYNIHARNGFDQGSMNIDLRQNAVFYMDIAMPLDSPAYDNATFSIGGICQVGNNQSGGPSGANAIVNDDWNTVDIMAHELTHGVTYHNGSGGLVYYGQSGAINESFSDIFGVNVYEHFGPVSPSNLWKIGYDRTNAMGVHSPIRNMKAPWLYGMPQAFNDTNYYYGTGDEGGVHFNSAVQNRMYYVLVKGDTFTNSFLESYAITGIGFNDARAIAYRTLTGAYLTPNANHQDARNAWVHAAVDLFGYCSIQAQTVSKAWDACNVHPPFQYDYPCGNISGPNYYPNNKDYYIAQGCNTTILGTGNHVDVEGARFVLINSGSLNGYFDTQAGAFFTARVTANDCYYSFY